MSWRNIGVIFGKELLDLSRDRKTLVFMILLPILVIPSMMWIMNRFVEAGGKSLTEEVSVIAVIGRDNAPALAELLDRLGEAANDPSALAGIDEPLLQQGLNNLMTGDELADALLALGALEELDPADRDAIGEARFLSLAPPESLGASAAERSFLRDADRLRLAASARVLASLEEVDVGALLRHGAGLVADRQRLQMMDEVGRAEVDRDVQTLERLGARLGSAVAADEVHAVLVLHDGFMESLREEGTASYTLLYDEAREASAAASRKLDRFLGRLGEGVVRARITGRRLAATTLEPFDGRELNLGRDRNFLAIFLPYVVLMMCFLGAIYPAIDLGAGEKERGTLETLLVTPASRLEFVLGKFLMITLAAVVASLLNVLSLVGSAQLGLLTQSEVFGAIVFDPVAVVVSIAVMVPVAALFAAVLLAVSIYAKSFKEAQSYSTPINFAILIPAFASFVPGIELTLPLSFAPLVNVSLALKEAWSGIFKWDCLAVILVSSALYAGAALYFCTRWFQREEVLFRT